MRTNARGAVSWLWSDGQRRELRSTAVTMVAVLASFGSALLVERVARLHVDVVVLAVVVAVTLARTQRTRTVRSRLTSLVVLPAAAACAAEVGSVMAQHANYGDALFAVAVSATIWARWLGPAFSRAGTLVTLPFIAILVTPMPLVPGHAHRLWSAVIALIAVSWVSIAQVGDDRLRGSGRRCAPTATATERPARAADGRAPSRRPASTRMAVQMAAALAVAFIVGRYFYPQHWSWMVLTTYIVGSGNRGRGDVAYKGTLRVLGAATGTIAATALAGLYPAGDTTSIVIIFAVLAAATWLRTASYAYWAGCITAALALLYGYYGQTGTILLRDRLGAIAGGAVIALVAAWFVLPVKTSDVVRRRIADLLAVLTEYLTAAREAPAELALQQCRLEHALDQLEQVGAPLRAHRRLPAGLRGHRPHLDDAVRALLTCRSPTRNLTGQLTAAGSVVVDPRALRHLQLRVVATRRALARHQEEAAATPEQDSASRPGRLPLESRANPLAQIDQAVATAFSVVAASSTRRAPETTDDLSSPARG